MRHANLDRIEGRLPDLPAPVTVAFEESGNPSGPPTEGMRNITAIVGMAAASMGGLAQMCSRPAALGNVTAGNNAAMPPASQRVSGLNAGALAGLANGLAGIGSSKKSAPKKESNPAPQPAPKPSSPKPASPAKDDGLLEPDWKNVPSNPSPSRASCDPAVQSCPAPNASYAANSGSGEIANAAASAPAAQCSPGSNS